MTRLDVELVRRGLVRSRRRAAQLVADGLVRVSGVPVRKVAHQVQQNDLIDVAATTEHVSRGATKLAGALDALAGLGTPLPVDGAHCLDAGASTGGFTEVLLAAGAAHVDAVDVGHGQLDPALAADPRVTLREGVNVRTLTADALSGVPQVLVADLSFISLTLVLAPLLGVLGPGGQALVLVKPQFEVGRDRVHDGVVTDPVLRAEAVLTVAGAVPDLFEVRALVPSPLPGSSGNLEVFAHVVDRGVGHRRVDLTGDLERAVRSAVAGHAALVRPVQHPPRRLT